MQWDVALGRALLITLTVSLSAAGIATAIGSLLGLLVVLVRVHGWRWIAAAVSCLLLVPVYVQATAWSAGFGSQGWFRLSQVDAARYPMWGLASVVWIQSVSAVPICFLIVSIGLRRVHDSAYQQAMIERGFAFALRHVVVRRLAPWIAGAFLWVFCSTQNDMVVTNLFQVPTLCESVYQQVQFGKLRSGPIACSLVLAIACGAALAYIALRASGSVATRDRPSGQHTIAPVHPAALNPSWVKGMASVVAWLLLGLTTLLPMMNLAVRLGWQSQMVEGQAVRNWSIIEAMNALGHARDFWPEIQWSVQLAAWSTALAVIAAYGLISLLPNRQPSIAILWVLGSMLAMPGPLVTLCVLHGFTNALPSQWSYLADQTLLAPILALQFRCLPIAYGVLWIAHRDYRNRLGSMLELEYAMGWRTRAWLWFRYAQGSLWTSVWLSFLIAFGDLATYLLLQPPGVTTVAMRLFDLLHYGIRNREASMALVLALVSGICSLWIAMRVQRAAQRSDAL